MTDRRLAKLDGIERALVLYFRKRPASAVPAGFADGVMRAVRQKAEERSGFAAVFGAAARRFVPVGALAATVACGYAQLSERLFDQTLLFLSLHGGAMSLVRLVP